MTFLKYPNGDWWEWDTENMKAFNICGGYHPINENSLGDCESMEFDSWHDLYINTGYNPLKTGISHDGWISPEGDFYECTAHEISAEYIYELVYGEGSKDAYCYGDALINKGWIKVTTSLMFDLYCTEKHYCNMGLCQERTFMKWYETYMDKD